MKRINTQIALASAFLFLFAIMVNLAYHKEENITSFATYDSTEQEAFNALVHAKADINDMVNAGFNVTLANDTYVQAQDAFQGANYTELIAQAQNISDATQREQAISLLLATKEAIAGGQTRDFNLVVEKANEIRKTKQDAFSASDQLTALDKKLSDLSKTPYINLSDAEDLYKSAKYAFYAERYADASALIDQAFTAADKSSAEVTEFTLLYNQSRETVLGFILYYWETIILAIIALTAVYIVLYPYVTILILRSKLNNLKLEGEVITDLIKRAQVERFQKGEITQREYEIRTERFRDRTTEIEKDMPVLQEDIDNVRKKGILAIFRRKK